MIVATLATLIVVTAATQFVLGHVFRRSSFFQTIVTSKSDIQGFFLAGRSMVWWPVSHMPGRECSHQLLFSLSGVTRCVSTSGDQETYYNLLKYLRPFFVIGVLMHSRRILQNAPPPLQLNVLFGASLTVKPSLAYITGLRIPNWSTIAVDTCQLYPYFSQETFQNVLRIYEQYVT